MNNKEDRRIKPISFNLNNEIDCELLSYAEKSGKSFGAYVKDLIRKDMYKENPNNNDIVNAINNIARILESKSFKIEQKEHKDIQENKEQKLSDEDKESKNIISNILNMGGKK